MDPVTASLEAVLQRHAAVPPQGVVADYIPELACADPDDFAVAMASVHGSVYRAGDHECEFTIQSVSKPFVYALALADLGLDEVAKHVGFEPSGEPFNAISLEPGTGRPANPLINAGAIVTTSLIPGDAEQSFERIRAGLSAFAGRELELDEAVYRSEAATGDRNRALGFLTLSQGVLARPAEEACDIYFRQCSLLVTVADLAVMAGTLARGGVNPLTMTAVVDPEVAKIALSVMATCGMYDRSGEWMVRVGLPAKSGVGGGIAAVLPGEFGLGVYSPPLDAQGNSVRAMAVLQEMSSRLGLHVFAPPAGSRSPIAASEVVDDTLTVRLRGELDFITAEQVSNHLLEQVLTRGIKRIDVDITHVTTVRAVAAELLRAVGIELRRHGLELMIEPPERIAAAAARVQQAPSVPFIGGPFATEPSAGRPSAAQPSAAQPPG
ncbi:glutaminase A [Catenulispora pinisilvae]|uniref:glutaminase A n=1 Tax=Catenulispora pinisilvae TaxID=2705253 RepID=UPI001891BD05|nr:glutaminase A [Catenulispora pinisilvae]